MPPSSDPSSDLPVDHAVRHLYQSIVDGEHRTGERGNVMFAVSTDDLADGRGDLFVALSLARGLLDAGWGVSLWPTPRLVDESPEDIDVAIVMIESFVPGMIHPRTKAIAWVRNWADQWAALPYLDEFCQVWCSSEESAELMRRSFDGPVHVVPIATDTELFHPRDAGERSPGVVTTANFWGVERGLTTALEGVAEHQQVTWFGANSRHLRVSGRIDHHDALDYFSLPWVYSQWRVVVDDVIESAARYGNQNSRLFDALACGAMVVTNTRNGLAELGLDDVPVYDDPEDLTRIVDALVADQEGTAERAARLREVVIARHSVAARSEVVRPHLEAALAEPERPERRSNLIRWATLEREERRRLELERDEWRTRFFDAADDNGRDRAELDAIRASFSYRVTRRLVAPLSRLAGRVLRRR